MFLSVLAIGLMILLGKRKGPGHWLSLPVLAALVGIGLSQPYTTQAEMVQRTLELQTSPANISLSSANNERLLVRNNTQQILRLESLSLQNGTANMRLFAPSDESQVPACRSGLVLPAQQACAIEVVVSENFALQANDVIQVKLSDLHPTQPSVGYDQIYYHLARKQPDLTRFASGTNLNRQLERTEQKRANDYCEDTGRGTSTNYVARSVSLINGTGFNCTISEDNVNANGLKTVVVGPNGQLYLTDGHHTFTTLWELKDGGPNLPVFVRVAANFSDSQNLTDFWQKMQANQYVWLFNAAGNAITPEQLPASLGLSHLADDPYRSLVYLTRDMGYHNSNVQEFAEFYWGLWLRGQNLDLNDYNLRDLTPAGVVAAANAANETADTGSSTSYVAAVRDAALLMRQATPGQDIYPDVTNTSLGQNIAAMSQNDWDTLLKEEIWQDDARESDNRYRNGGKAWYATGWRLCGAPVDNPTCWQENMIVDHVTPQ